MIWIGYVFAAVGLFYAGYQHGRRVQCKAFLNACEEVVKTDWQNLELVVLSQSPVLSRGGMSMIGTTGVPGDVTVTKMRAEDGK